MKKVIEITDEVEKILVEVLDTYLKTKGLSGNPVVTKFLSFIKQVEDKE